MNVSKVTYHRRPTGYLNVTSNHWRSHILISEVRESFSVLA